jgi:hypothetical protein
MRSTTFLGLLGGASVMMAMGYLTLTTEASPDRGMSERTAPVEATSSQEAASDKSREEEIATLAPGPNVVYSGIHQVNTYGPVGGVYAYIPGTQTCNIGTGHLLWQNGGTPGVAFNAYRLHGGRLTQIGLSFVKHACCVANQNNPTLCAGMTCQGGPGGHLRIGCLDVYSASWNANQNYLGPRTGINPYSGAFSSFSTAGGSAIFKRLQVHVDEMNPAIYPDALYFIDGVYVGTDDAQAGNWYDDASYRRVTLNGVYTMSLADTTQVYTPTIYAWRDYGNGVGQPDLTVKINIVDVPNEGRFYVGYKTIDNGDGTWRYEYAVYNHFSQRAGGSFSVPVGYGANITNVGFSAPLYHSGENQSNTPWNVAVGPGSVTWTTAQSHAQNPNDNAIRWGTLYNFWFTADTPPTVDDAMLGLFIPGTPSSVSTMVAAPSAGAAPCPADLNGDDVVDVLDLLDLLDAWGPNPGHPADLNGDGTVDVLDLLELLDAWGPCL